MHIGNQFSLAMHYENVAVCIMRWSTVQLERLVNDSDSERREHILAIDLKLVILESHGNGLVCDSILHSLPCMHQYLVWTTHVSSCNPPQ